jgi:hypothetical protein
MPNTIKLHIPLLVSTLFFAVLLFIGTAPSFSQNYVLSYFTPVSGTVVGTDSGEARVTFSTDKDLKKGMRLSVFSKDKPFYHPVTRELIGSSEVLVGRVEIGNKKTVPDSSAGEVTYLCRVVEGSPGKGDIVRVSSSRVTLAFFQKRDSEWSISDAFYNSLKDSGRFNLVEAYTKNFEHEELSRLAGTLGAEAVVLFSTPVKDDTSYLRTELFWSRDTELFASHELAAGSNPAGDITFGESLISVESIDGEPLGVHKIKSGEFIAVGDVDGKGEKELVVSNGSDIIIYSYNDTPREMWSISGSNREQHISLGVLDLNGNGRAEIFVTSFIDMEFDSDVTDSKMQKRKYEKKTVSYVLEFDSDEGYKRIWNNAPYILRVVGRDLLMQGLVSHMSPSGPVYMGEWEDGHYRTGKPLDLPAGIDTYGFAFVDWLNTGQIQILAFDELGFLRLFSGSELIWKSKSSYGGFKTSITVKDSIANPDKEWIVKGRLTTVITKQGQSVMAVKKIPYVKKLAGLGYKKTEVYTLRWDGESMTETLVAGNIRGTVTDYWLEPDTLLLLARPDMFATLKSSLSGDLVKGSLLYYYQFEGK